MQVCKYAIEEYTIGKNGISQSLNAFYMCQQSHSYNIIGSTSLANKLLTILQTNFLSESS